MTYDGPEHRAFEVYADDELAANRAGLHLARELGWQTKTRLRTYRHADGAPRHWIVELAVRRAPVEP